MGASTDFRRYKASLGQDTIKKLWDGAVAQSRYEDGHSYSGQIGMLGGIRSWNDLNLPDMAAADEYISENHEKWQAAMAVSYTDKGEKYWLIGGWCSS
jgi:hypothetical protein